MITSSNAMIQPDEAANHDWLPSFFGCFTNVEQRENTIPIINHFTISAMISAVMLVIFECDR
jgi:hypothetical protein